jgi:hypothetical protein
MAPETEIALKMAQNSSFLSRFCDWAKSQIVQDVPKDLAHCVFECKKDECTAEHWNQCERRLKAAKAGRPIRKVVP